jgi:hypothetical protein
VESAIVFTCEVRIEAYRDPFELATPLDYQHVISRPLQSVAEGVTPWVALLVNGTRTFMGNRLPAVDVQVQR